MKRILIPFAAIVLLASCGSNESTKDSVEKADSTNATKMDSSSTAAPIIKADEATTEFLVKAANGGMAEIKLAEVAKEKSKDSTVLNFAAMMTEDHGGANEKLKKLAAERNITLPSTPGDDEQKKAAELSKKTGKDFDKAYVDAMVKGHSETVDMFKKASGKVADADVKAFIDNTIPVIEHHLERIKDIKKGLK